MQRNVTDILNEWFYRLPNGYAIEPYGDTELQVLSKVLTENDIDPKPIIKNIKEAPADHQFIPGKDKLKTNTEPVPEEGNTDYNTAIKRRLQVDVIPIPKGNYRVEEGSFDLDINPADKEIFELLWPENDK